VTAAAALVEALGRGLPADRPAFEQFLDAAIALGGTVTGEHGVGILKREGMRRELDPGSPSIWISVLWLFGS